MPETDIDLHIRESQPRPVSVPSTGLSRGQTVLWLPR